MWGLPRAWLRRTFDLPEGLDARNLYLVMHHDEDAEVYLNGVPGGERGGVHDVLPRRCP